MPPADDKRKQIVGALLDGALRIGARAVSKAVESVLEDARDVIEGKRRRVEAFRRREVDEEDVKVTAGEGSGENKKAAER